MAFCSVKQRLLDEFIGAVSESLRMEFLFPMTSKRHVNGKEAAKEAIKAHQKEVDPARTT
jgi:hypothetical protein